MSRKPPSAAQAGCLAVEERTAPPRVRRTKSAPAENKTNAPKEQPAPALPSSRRPLRKRRVAAPGVDAAIDEPCGAKKARTCSERPAGSSPDQAYNPVAYWTEHLHWPDEIRQRGLGMDNSAPGRKRRSESTHRSAYSRRLAANGVFTASSALMHRSSQELCEKLLDESADMSQYMPLPEDRLRDVLLRVQTLNEARIQRDVTPWVVPSAEQLYFCGEADVAYVADEVCALWSRCETLGSKMPKPDYTAGLKPQAFTPAELAKLENYAVPRRPAFFTPELCFPFLVCEVKASQQALFLAEKQNIHSGSMAVKAIIELYRTALGDDSPKTKDLSGKVLVFTVCHDHDSVKLHGHYAVLANEASPRGSKRAAPRWEFHREPIALFGLSVMGGRDRLRSYKFVRNVYQHFAPQHLQRIKEAASHLQDPDPRADTLEDDPISQRESMDASRAGRSGADDSVAWTHRQPSEAVV